MDILEIGPNIKPQAQAIWKDANVKTFDALEVYPDGTKPDFVGDAEHLTDVTGKEVFDGILASHVLEHFSYWKTVDILKEWTSALKPEGELHIVVPSLEWAARQILAETPSPALWPHMYAGQINQYDLHYTGFTMRSLRALFERAGLVTVAAKTGAYTITVRGEQYQADQHYIKGVKR